MSINIKEIVEHIKQAPRMSKTTNLLLNKIGEEEHTLKDITDIVEVDSLLTSLALKTANSASYGLNRNIESVEDAIKYLGDTVIAGLSLGTEKIYSADMSGYAAETGDNWSHSLRTAVAAKYIAKNFTKDIKNQVAYTAGIVHDIGKTILSYYLTDHLNELDPEILSFEEKEKEFLGITHSEAGYLLSRNWKLPTSIAEVVRYHHSPKDSSEEYRKLVYVVHLADIIAMIGGTGTGIDTMCYTLDPNYINYIPIKDIEFEKALIDIESEYQKSYEAFNIVLKG